MLDVRPAERDHYPRIVDYFLQADPEFLLGMGVDRRLLPAREAWLKTLLENHERKNENKHIFYVIWYVDNEAIGHSNINKIIFGEEAYMHLHMWQPETRKKGLGLQLVSASTPQFFQNFELQNLFCEPYALNPAPNHTLKKSGFEFVKEYETTPGVISFLQPVKRWLLTRRRFEERYGREIR